MIAVLSKKIRLLLDLGALNYYVLQRLTVALKSFLGVRPFYPFEDELHFDSGTHKILESLQTQISTDKLGYSRNFRIRGIPILTREKYGEEVSQKINSIIPHELTFNHPHILNELRNKGNTRLAEVALSNDGVEDIMDYLQDKKAYFAHACTFSLSKPDSFEVVKKSGTPFGSYDLETMLKAPGLAKIVADEKVLSLVANYFGCLPTLAIVNLFWSFLLPKGVPYGTQRFHRDVEDYKYVTLFVYLTDTGQDDGAYCTIEHTHSYGSLSKIFDDRRNDSLPPENNPLNHRLTASDMFNLPMRGGYGFDTLYSHFFSEHIKQLPGKAGTSFIADAFGIHRGIPPRSRNRLLFWVSYSLTSTPNNNNSIKSMKRVPYSTLKNEIPDTKEMRYFLRNFVDFS